MLLTMGPLTVLIEALGADWLLTEFTVVRKGVRLVEITITNWIVNRASRQASFLNPTTYFWMIPSVLGA